MTAITIRLHDTSSNRTKDFPIDTADPMGRAFARWICREVPGSFDLAKLVFPDDVCIVERLGDPLDPHTVTRCRNGVPDIIAPARNPIGEYNPLVPVSSQSIQDYWEVEGAKNEAYDAAIERINLAALFLDANSSDAAETSSEFEEKLNHLLAVVDEALAAGRMMGDIWIYRLKLDLSDLIAKLPGGSQ